MRTASPGNDLRAVAFSAALLAVCGVASEGVAAESTGDAILAETGLRAPDNCAPSPAGRCAPDVGLRLLAAAPADPPKDAKEGVDALLDDDLTSQQSSGIGVHGFYQFEGAYTLPSPAHWSKLLNRLELNSEGRLSENVKWRLGVRADYDAIYDLSDFYSSQVKKNQRFDLALRENYLDIAAGDVEFRLGRQQIVWGEVVGLFFADVVSAKDLRESVLPDFELLRIPQWAGRVEWFKGDTHLEAIWIPIPTVDEIGKPGSNFYSYPPAPPPGYGYLIRDEQKPRRNSSNENFGIRLSTLIQGWDLAGFAYRSVDSSPTFYREVVNAPGPTIVYTPRHDKITQFGATLAQDFEAFLLKAEAVFAQGQNFNVTRLSDSDGVVRQNYLDYIVSMEFSLPDEARLNLQFFQRRFTNHDPDIIPDSIESGASVFWSGKWGSRFAPQILAIHSLNRSDWMVRPRVVWNFETNWRAAVGADVFGGRPTGLFGQFNHQDRVYAELRRSF